MKEEGGDEERVGGWYEGEGECYGVYFFCRYSPLLLFFSFDHETDMEEEEEEEEEEEVK